MASAAPSASGLPAIQKVPNFTEVQHLFETSHLNSGVVHFMKLSRRKYLHLAASAGVVTAVAGSAWAQAYPSRPIRILVGFPAGGTPDILTRIIGQRLQERLGQPVVVENKPGASGNIATLAAARSAADGYTLLSVGAPNAINATLYQTPDFDFMRDIAPVAGAARLPDVIVVNPEFPARTVAEFIGYAKANPGKVIMASAGNGTSGHMAGELFKMMAGIDLLHVPYRGGLPAVTDLLAGRVQVLFDVVTNSIDLVRAGKLRALAVTTTARCPALPDIPTAAQSVPGYEASYWMGFGAPNGTPTDIVEKLNGEINAALADPAIKARIADMGGSALALAPPQLGKFMADEIDKWAKVIRAANIKAA
jgi:tripartite-type tricarboxylate transporter receptor subunit TctC